MRLSPYSMAADDSNVNLTSTCSAFRTSGFRSPHEEGRLIRQVVEPPYL